MAKSRLPSDQFKRVQDELHKLNLVVDEVQKAVDTTEAINTFESGTNLSKAREHIEMAGFWLDKALKALEKAEKPKGPWPDDD